MVTDDISRPDAIAAAVLDIFERLPDNRKPAIRANGVHEWVPLSGIVAEFSDGRMECIAIATGMKCLPASRLLKANGVGIHDWHAEVLAIRAFNRFVLQECFDISQEAKTSPFLRLRDASAGCEGDGQSGQPFQWHDDISLHMYCSEAPCGDASMELIIAAQDDTSPWTLPRDEAVAVQATAQTTEQAATHLAGRGYFSRLGTVRRKPGRGDAPLSLSKSCSDKLALRQCTTLLSAVTALFVAPSPALCLCTIVLHEAQHDERACQRCFGHDRATDGRMWPVAGRRWPGPYTYVPLTVHTTTRVFTYSKARISQTAAATASSNLAVVWTRNGATNECLVGGVLQGRKAFSSAGAGATSRKQMWRLAQETAAALTQNVASHVVDAQALSEYLQAPSYAAIKSGLLLAARAQVKADVRQLALKGWTRNEGDNDWGLES